MRKLPCVPTIVLFATLILCSCGFYYYHQNVKNWENAKAQLVGMSEDQLVSCAGPPFATERSESQNVLTWGYLETFSHAASWCILSVKSETGKIIDYTTRSENPGGVTDGSSTCSYILNGCFANTSPKVGAGGFVERLSAIPNSAAIMVGVYDRIIQTTLLTTAIWQSQGAQANPSTPPAQVSTAAVAPVRSSATQGQSAVSRAQPVPPAPPGSQEVAFSKPPVIAPTRPTQSTSAKQQPVQPRPPSPTAPATAREPSPSDSASCFGNRITGSQTEPVIQLTNFCSFPVNWNLCVNIQGRVARDFSTGSTAPNSISFYRAFKDAGGNLFYNVNHCAGSRCSVSAPSC